MAQPFTPYGCSIAVAKDALRTLTSILKKAEGSLSASSLPSARIYPDMQPLSFQIQQTCMQAAKLVTRTTDAELPDWVYDELKTFKDMYLRIDMTQEILAGADEDVVNKRVVGTISLPTEAGGTEEASTHAWIFSYNLPNLYFHLVTAYDILRKEGIPLGKQDYLEAFDQTFRRG